MISDLMGGYIYVCYTFEYISIYIVVNRNIQNPDGYSKDGKEVLPISNLLIMVLAHLPTACYRPDDHIFLH